MITDHKQQIDDYSKVGMNKYPDSLSGLGQTKWVDKKEVQGSIESCIKSLGSMVMKPQYESDTQQIGSKKYVGNTQMPIIEKEEDRQLITDKLLNLIKQL